jgi:hypothetical protein
MWEGAAPTNRKCGRLMAEKKNDKGLEVKKTTKNKSEAALR